MHRSADEPDQLMTQTRRSAPDPEWVQMYRSGIRTPKIAEVAGAANTTVRYHLAIAAKQDPGLRAEHHAALSKPQRVTAPGQQNLDDVLAFYEAEGRLPAKNRTDRERALATWLHRRRKDVAEGTLSSFYAQALDSIPGWREQPTKREADEARWKQRLAEVAAYMAAGNQWPRHNKTDDQEERTLGVWLHTQRITYRAGKLTPAKENQLDKVISGWRQGRQRRAANSRTAVERTTSRAGGISGQL